MADITGHITSYLEAKRHLWNTYFVHQVDSIRSCSVLDDFEDIDRLLFSALVLRKIGKTLPLDFIYGKEEIPFLKVVPNVGIDSLNLMTTDPLISAYVKWNTPVEIEINSDVEFIYIELFEWDRYKFVNYPYYLAKIVASQKQKELIGRNVLIETHSAKIFFCDVK